MELGHVKTIRPTMRSMSNKLDSVLLESIIYDSSTRAILSNERRHHNILTGLADLFSQGGPEGEEYFGLGEKHTYQGADHGHKARQF